MRDKPQVFLSYAHDDLETVRRLYDALVEREVNVWFDKGSIRPGRWKKQIEKAIPQSRYFIFCVSSASIKKTADGSGFVDDELQQAYEIARDLDERNFTIVPVRLEEAGHGDRRLQIFQQYDLFEDWEGEVDRLAVYMGGRAIASEDLEEELSNIEITIRQLRTRAEGAFLAGDFEKALQFFDTSYSLNPDHIDAWYDTFHIQAINNQLEEAIRLEPSNAEEWHNKGVALQGLGRHVEAAMAFARARELGYEG